MNKIKTKLEEEIPEYVLNSVEITESITLEQVAIVFTELEADGSLPKDKNDYYITYRVCLIATGQSREQYLNNHVDDELSLDMKELSAFKKNCKKYEK